MRLKLNKIVLWLGVCVTPLVFCLHAYSKPANFNYYFHHPAYVGLLGGFGSTDWSMLVADCNNPWGTFGSSCSSTVPSSAPIQAGDKGFVWGAVVGYEIQPHFALEAAYEDFPNTTVVFGDENFYNASMSAFSFVSQTDAYSLVGKFMVQIANSGVRGFANAGAALTHRSDMLNNIYHFTPTFGFGFDYVFRRHWMFVTGFQYYCGYGEANLTPAVNYIPFLYSLHVVMAYRF